MIAAGLDGIEAKRDPATRYDNNAYTARLPAGKAFTLPKSLLDALHDLEHNRILPERMGQDFTAAYLKLQHQA